MKNILFGLKVLIPLFLAIAIFSVALSFMISLIGQKAAAYVIIIVMMLVLAYGIGYEFR